MRADGRTGGRPLGRALLVAALTLSAYAPIRLSAQHLSAGPRFVFADYREVSGNLHYDGTGFGAGAAFSWKKFGAGFEYARVDYQPADDATAPLGFTAVQLDARVRYYVTGPVSAELGFTRRTVDPDFTAQEAGAVRVGVYLAQGIGTGTRLYLRGNYLAAAKFSGGGSAPFGVAVGLGINGDFAGNRVRVSADYEFQRLDRETDDGSGAVDVPIQQAMLRFGVAAGF